MRSLPEIIEDNKVGDTVPTPIRRCSVDPNLPMGVILHSARNRDTKLVQGSSPYQMNFLKRVCALYKVPFDQLVNDWQSIDSDALDQVVESYWGHYPQPDQKSTPGYDEA